MDYGLAIDALMSNVASASEVRVMIAAGFFDVYSELSPEFERTSGHRLITTRGPVIRRKRFPRASDAARARTWSSWKAGRRINPANRVWCAPMARSC